MFIIILLVWSHLCHSSLSCPRVLLELLWPTVEITFPRAPSTLLWHPHWTWARSTSQAWETVRTFLSLPLYLHTSWFQPSYVASFCVGRALHTRAEWHFCYSVFFFSFFLGCRLWKSSVVTLDNICLVCMEAHSCQEKKKNLIKRMMDNNNYELVSQNDVCMFRLWPTELKFYNTKSWLWEKKSLYWDGVL